jgi:hypothetical protein
MVYVLPLKLIQKKKHTHTHARTHTRTHTHTHIYKEHYAELISKFVSTWGNHATHPLQPTNECNLCT